MIRSKIPHLRLIWQHTLVVEYIIDESIFVKPSGRDLLLNGAEHHDNRRRKL